MNCLQGCSSVCLYGVKKGMTCPKIFALQYNHPRDRMADNHLSFAKRCTRVQCCLQNLPKIGCPYKSAQVSVILLRPLQLQSCTVGSLSCSLAYAWPIPRRYRIFRLVQCSTGAPAHSLSLWLWNSSRWTGARSASNAAAVHKLAPLPLFDAL